VPEATRTLCPYCGVGCGLIARTKGERLTGVEGDPRYPVNRGRTCRKPLELPSAVHARDRAREPLLREGAEGRFRATTWDEAIASLAGRLSEIRERHGPDAIAFYVSGQLLTEDYYVANKLVKGFLGTNNIDSNSRLCMSSAVAGYRGAFGFDGPPPSYADLDLADCFLLLGSNAAACHPIVWGRIVQRRREGAFVICADPRATPTAQQSDLHLPVRPGSDLPLLNALLHVVLAESLHDERFVAARTSGFEQAAAVARQWPPERASEVCGVSAQDIRTAARRFGASPRSMALWSMGANQSTVGTLKNRALINLCLACGQIGRPGAGPLSLTGQPNAMGGRETGGLAHLLPGYRSVESLPDRVEMEELWRCPPISPVPGLPAVALFDALAEGRLKAVWIVATNPAVSLPHGARARAALERAELLVVQDAHHPTETSALAHAVLPAAAWPEKTGTMTNSERRVGLVTAALPAPGLALPDWRIFARLAGELGFGERFAWASEAEVFAEYARATAGRPCDLSGISHERLAREGSIQWPCPAAPGGEETGAGTARLYESHRFPTPDGRARFAPTPHAPPAEAPTPERPLLLATGRVAEHWHTMTRTGKSPTLRAAASEPVLELNPQDAAEAGLQDGRPARVASARGAAILRVQVSQAIPAGVAFAPMHWGALHAPPGAGTVNTLTHGSCDPSSHQPELKATAVSVTPARERTRVGAAGRRGVRRLVVVGTGMAGLEVVQELLRRTEPGAWQVTMLGEEPGPPYNRILLSKLLARTCGEPELELRPASWYAEHGIELLGGNPAGRLDIRERTVLDARGSRHPYDALVLATGSRPFVPPIAGRERPHVRCFRTLADTHALTAAARAGRPAVVVGGGLLGLEAAAGLAARGMRVTVIELADRPMPQQLDAGAAAMLRRGLAGMGVDVRSGSAVAEIASDRLTLADGEELAAELVVLSAGVRAETSLAQAAGIEVGRGILVDDQMRCGAPAVWAIGECAEHRGVVQGLWAPVAEQARVAGATIAGDPAGFFGATPATTLKVAGIELFAGGTPSAGLASAQEEIVFSDSRRGVYRKLVLDGERLAGALLLGELGAARTLSGLLRSGAPVPEELLTGAAPPAAAVAEEADGLVCACNSVSRASILSAIATGGLRTVAQVASATRASTGCGSCVREIEALLAGSSDRNTANTAMKRPASTIPA
jgi:ferredoxin-nitrate reductase